MLLITVKKIFFALKEGCLFLDFQFQNGEET